MPSGSGSDPAASRRAGSVAPWTASTEAEGSAPAEPGATRCEGDGAVPWGSSLPHAGPAVGKARRVPPSDLTARRGCCRRCGEQDCPAPSWPLVTPPKSSEYRAGRDVGFGVARCRRCLWRGRWPWLHGDLQQDTGPFRAGRDRRCQLACGHCGFRPCRHSVSRLCGPRQLRWACWV